MSQNISETQVVQPAKQLGIGGTPADTAKLDVQSTTQGLLVPRMTTTQRDLIVSPADSLMIYNLTTHQYEYYDLNATAWKAMSGDDTGITQLTGDVTAGPGSGSQAATIGTGKVTPAKISAINTDNFTFPNDVIVKGILKYDGGTTKWQTYVVGNTDLYFRDTTNNRNLLALSQNGIVQIPSGIYFDFAGGAGFRCGATTTFYIGASSINASAIMQLDSTTQGFRPPAMTTTQRDAIASPTAGLVIYNTSTAKLNLYTTAWEEVTSA